MPTGGKQARPAARARRRCSLNSPCGRGGIHQSQGGKAALRRPGGRLLVQQRRPARGCPPGSMRSCPNALTGAVLGRREARYSMSLDQDSAIHASGPGPVETLPTGPGGSHGKEQRLPYVPSGGVLQRLPRFRCTGAASKSGFQPDKERLNDEAPQDPALAMAESAEQIHPLPEPSDERPDLNITTWQRAANGMRLP